MNDKTTQRIQQLTRRFSNNQACLIYSGAPCLRNGDTHYPFRVDSNFYYFTQQTLQNSYFLMVQHARKIHLFLFHDTPTNTQKTWENLPTIESHQCDQWGAKGPLPLCKILPTLQQFKTLNTLFHNLPICEQTQGFLDKIKHESWQQKSIQSYTGALRLLKDNEEIQCIKRACEFSVEAHQMVANACSGLTHEYQAQAIFESSVRHLGADGLAYPSIVAAGERGCVLHYQQNNQPILTGDLLLIDAGCEHQMYASDITRTWCKGKPSSEQIALHEVVCDAQKQLIENLTPNQTFFEIQKNAIELLTYGLIHLGLLQGSLERCIKKEQYRRFYMHSFGHHLGLDVHDPCPYNDNNGRSLNLQVGMVFTVEPGLYIPNEPDIPVAFRGQAVRIEDVVHWSDEGAYVLSDGLRHALVE